MRTAVHILDTLSSLAGYCRYRLCAIIIHHPHATGPTASIYAGSNRYIHLIFEWASFVTDDRFEGCTGCLLRWVCQLKRGVVHDSSIVKPQCICPPPLSYFMHVLYVAARSIDVSLYVDIIHIETIYHLTYVDIPT